IRIAGAHIDRGRRADMKVRYVLAIILIFAAGFAAGQGLPGKRGRSVTEPGGGVTVPPTALAPLPEGLSAEEKRDIEVFRRAQPSVVYITSIALRRSIFSFDVQQIPQGTGSGFVWDRRGHVVTNFHVIQEGDAFSVTLADQSEWEAKVAGVAPEKDLAVLKIGTPADRLVPLTPGNSRGLLVGQRVLAVGNPFGLDHSLTVGVVSALGRELQSPKGHRIPDVIQTDAAINPGNSGGPLLDSTGRLIGVNAAIFSPSGASAGIGFAVPVDTVNRIVPELIRYGKITRPGIGVQAAEDQIAQQIGVKGVLVVYVVAGSAAAKAGIRPTKREASGRVSLGDVMVAVDGVKVGSPNDLFLALEKYKIGDTVNFSLLRDGKTVQTRVTLEGVQ